jgi:hypothetical protein
MDADRKIHDKSHGKSLEWYPMAKFIADIDPCNTYAVKLSDCLLSKGESDKNVVACFACLGKVYESHLIDGYMCADLKEIDYCDAVEDCAVGACNNFCSADLNDVEESVTSFDGCINESFYMNKCIYGI